MKSHVLLLGRILEDLSIRCSASTERDLKTIVSRVEDEGGSFLTITLPKFGKDLERALDQKQVDSSHFRGFRKCGALPSFGIGLSSLIFDKVSGALLDDPSIDAIQGLRQISYLFQKIELPCSQGRVEAAYRKYIECEQSVWDSRLSRNSNYVADFKRVSRLLFGDIFSKLDREIYEGKVVPKHGPGSTADRTLGNAKYSYKVWTERLEEIFPAMDFLYASPRHYFNAVEDGVGPVWLEPGAEPPVRVVSVPKTLKTPRIIAIEPVHMQYVQQGLMEMFVRELERDDILTSSMIGFTDQEPNRTMACQGSRELDLATLDLSEASDRVSIQHVELLLSDYEWLRHAVFACRSSKADIPGYGVRTLAKYASMGSALTFPIEAMVFLTIVFIGIEKELNAPYLTEEAVKGFLGKVRVYGDDIIVPVRYAVSVVETLEAFGLQVNHDKSFWTGMFRESCGGDYYAGHDVTVMKLRRVLPEQRQHSSEIISAVSFRNQAYEAGYWRTAEFMDAWIKRFIPFPSVHRLSPALGRHTFLDYDVQRVCPFLQRPLVKAAVEDTLLPQSPLGGQDALVKYFLKRGDEPFEEKHLERAGRPDAVNIKLRWVTPY